MDVDHPALARIAGALPGAVCITIDRSDDPRPTRKPGVLLRGSAGVLRADEALATLAVRVGRISAWDGFDVAAPSVPASRG